MKFAPYTSGRLRKLKVGITSDPNSSTALNVLGGVNIVGVITANSISISTTTATSDFANLNITGVSTFGGNIDVNADVVIDGDIDVDGHTNLDNVTITGLTTFTNSTNVAGLRLRSFATNSGFVTGEMRVLESPSNTILQGGPMIQLMTNNTSAPLNGAGDREEINFFTTLYAGSFLQDGSLQLNKNFNVAGISTFTGNINANGNIVGDNATNISGINSVTATKFFGDGSGLENTGATLSAASGAQRLVLTSLTSGTMTSAATDADLSFNAASNLLSAGKLLSSSY